MVFMAATTSLEFFVMSPIIIFIGLVHTVLVNLTLKVTMSGFSGDEGFTPVDITNFEFVVMMHMFMHHWHDEVQQIFSKSTQRPSRT
jgi:hypothetical protein